MYRELDYGKTLDTIGRLQQRIADRFPDSGLRRVCGEVHDLAVDGHRKVEWLARPNLWIRGAVLVLVLLGVGGVAYSISLVDLTLKRPGLGEIIQLTEAAINDVVLISAAVFFLVTIELRIKRARALKALHELRAIAHVVDMHQLTKDPGMLEPGASATASSPARVMTPFELKRYLDYCSEMLSLIGKLSALYSQGLPDPVVVSAANDIESLCSGLSRKIWQKIMVIEDLAQPPSPA